MEGIGRSREGPDLHRRQVGDRALPTERRPAFASPWLEAPSKAAKAARTPAADAALDPPTRRARPCRRASTGRSLALGAVIERGAPSIPKALPGAEAVHPSRVRPPPRRTLHPMGSASNASTTAAISRRPGIEAPNETCREKGGPEEGSGPLATSGGARRSDKARALPMPLTPPTPGTIV